MLSKREWSKLMCMASAVALMGMLPATMVLAQQSYDTAIDVITTSDVQEIAAEQENIIISNPGELTFFTDRTTFNSVCPVLPLEDFDDTNIGSDSVEVCSSTFNSLTNNVCYAPGAILEGITLSASNEMVVLTPSSYGVQSTVVGPNMFSDNLTMTFPNDDVTAVGMDLLDPIQQATVDVSVFGPEDVLLGEIQVVTGLFTGNFLGVRSNDIITRISFNQIAGGGGELVDDVSFGLCTLPVTIDIKPESDENSINLCSNGAVPVAILGSDTFDVNDIDTDSLRLADAAVKVVGKKDPKTLCSIEDVNADYYDDLVCHFNTTELSSILDGTSTSATVKGETVEGTPIEGSDTITIVKDECE